MFLVVEIYWVYLNMHWHSLFQTATPWTSGMHSYNFMTKRKCGKESAEKKVSLVFETTSFCWFKLLTEMICFWRLFPRKCLKPFRNSQKLSGKFSRKNEKTHLNSWTRVSRQAFCQLWKIMSTVSGQNKNNITSFFFISCDHLCDINFKNRTANQFAFKFPTFKFPAFKFPTSKNNFQCWFRNWYRNEGTWGKKRSWQAVWLDSPSICLMGSTQFNALSQSLSWTSSWPYPLPLPSCFSSCSPCSHLWSPQQ